MNAPDRYKSNRLLGHGPTVLWAMIAGGILWIVYGYFRFVTPQGPDVEWREELGYSPILSTELFLLYNVPGVLAILLTLWGTLSHVHSLRTEHTRLKLAAWIAALLASVLGLLATAGQVILFDPLKTFGLAVGTPILGLAIFLAGLAVVRDGKTQNGPSLRVGPVLMLLGVIGMFTLPLRPLMFALSLLPLAFGAAAFALFGASWILLASSLRKMPEWRTERPTRSAIA